MHKLAMGMLCYARPIHTALALGFAFSNKSSNTDLYAFYGIPEIGEHKSPSLLNLLMNLDSAGYLKLNYLPDAYPRNTEGNVNNLMYTLHRLDGYSCYFKIDDDVLIGRGTDIQLAEYLLNPVLDEAKVYLLSAQTVREHMQGPSAFGWETKLGDSVMVIRRNGMSPMETYVAVSYKMLPHLKSAGYRTGCENAVGTFGPYSKKLFLSGAKSAVVLYPNLVMQHIGLTCTTGKTDAVVSRSWAPAKHWSPIGKTVELPHFDFTEWEKSHVLKLHKEFALKTLQRLYNESIVHPGASGSSAINMVIDGLEAYTPDDGDVPLPAGKPAGRGLRSAGRRRTMVRSLRRR